MKTVGLVWKRHRRIRIVHLAPSTANHRARLTHRCSSVVNCSSSRGGACTAPPPPPYKEAFAVQTVALEQHHVAGVQPLLLHEPAPPFRQHVALATVPIRIPKPFFSFQFILKKKKEKEKYLIINIYSLNT